MDDDLVRPPAHVEVTADEELGGGAREPPKRHRLASELFEAIANNQPLDDQVISHLGTTIDERRSEDEDGRQDTLLTFGARKGNLSAVMQLVECGAALEGTNGSGNTSTPSCFF